MKRKIFYGAIISVIIFILLRAQSIITYTKDALIMCYDFIIPTLFPFFVCSGILIYSGFAAFISKYAHSFMRPLFNVPSSGATAFVTGIISGFPMGAYCAKELYLNGNLSKSEAERLLSFCNNSGPLFIIGTIGTALYTNPLYGVILYVIHIISSVIVGVVFRNYGAAHHNSPPTTVNNREFSITQSVSVALNEASKNIVLVCFSIVFFSALSRAILDIIPMNNLFNALISGLCEFSTGVIKTATLNEALAHRLVITSFIVGFSGLCVHIQVMAVTAGAGLSLVPYILGKALHSITAAVMTAAVMYPVLLNKAESVPNIPVLSHSFIISLCLIAAVSIVVIIISKIQKRKSAL